MPIQHRDLAGGTWQRLSLAKLGNVGSEISPP